MRTRRVQRYVSTNNPVFSKLFSLTMPTVRDSLPGADAVLHEKLRCTSATTQSKRLPNCDVSAPSPKANVSLAPECARLPPLASSLRQRRPGQVRYTRAHLLKDGSAAGKWFSGTSSSWPPVHDVSVYTLLRARKVDRLLITDNRRRKTRHGGACTITARCQLAPQAAPPDNSWPASVSM